MIDAPSGPSGPRTSFRWVIVVLLCGVAFVLSVDRVNITVAAPHIRDHFRMSDEGLGGVLGAFMFGYAVGLIPGGWLADRWGPRPLLAAATFLWGIFTLAIGLVGAEGLLGFEGAWTALVVARFLLGLCEACAFPAFARTVANWMFRHERARATGLVQSAFTLGGALTPLAVRWVIAEFGWREAFYVSAFLTFLVALLWWAKARNRPEEHPGVSSHEMAAIASQREEQNPLRPDRFWWAQLARSREVYLLCLSQFLFGSAGFVFFSWFYTYFTEHRQADAELSAGFQALAYAMMTVGATVGGWLGDLSFRRFGNPWGRRLVPLASITLGGCLGIIAPIIPNNLLAGITFAMVAGLLYTAASSFWSTVIDLTRRGTGLLGGLQNAANWTGAALTTTLLPTFVRVWHIPWSAALQIAGVLGILSGLTWLMLNPARSIDAHCAEKGFTEMNRTR